MTCETHGVLNCFNCGSRGYKAGRCWFPGCNEKHTRRIKLDVNKGDGRISLEGKFCFQHFMNAIPEYEIILKVMKVE